MIGILKARLKNLKRVTYYPIIFWKLLIVEEKYFLMVFVVLDIKNHREAS